MFRGLILAMAVLAAGCGIKRGYVQAPAANLGPGVKSVDRVFQPPAKSHCFAEFTSMSGVKVLFESNNAEGCKDLASAAKTVTSLQAAAAAKQAAQKPAPEPEAQK